MCALVSLPLPPIEVLVAPTDGRVRTALPAGAEVTAGTVVAVLHSSGGPVAIRARRSGRIAATLVEADQLVRAGEVVAWLPRP